MLRTTGICILLLLSYFISANNIAVSNVFTTGQGATSGGTVVQFDLSWENSWRVTAGAANWDAAWVFVKYRANGGNWQHATLTGPGTLPAGASVDVMDGTGAMIYRAEPGSGDVDFQAVQLRWDYSGDGVANDDMIDVRVFAIEMVYVPEGAFYVGDGLQARNEFYAGGSRANPQPYQITSEDAIRVADTPGNLYYFNSDSGAGDRAGIIRDAFPKGFAAFYVAKYETSQQQWVDFFNTLPANLHNNFDITRGTRYQNASGTKAHNGVTAPVNGTISTSRPATPMNWVDQRRALAYLDWAGLRPWSELEFEKAARGSLYPIAGEYAHGTDETSFPDPVVVNEGQVDSRITNLAANEGHFVFGIDSDREPGEAGENGPFRCGIVAASAPNATRQETGGSYYGVMDMSGNLWERIVTVGGPFGRNFIPNHGDGSISPVGLHNVVGWPAGNQAAYGIKGCAYVSGSGANGTRVARCTVSARRNAASNRDRGDHDYALFRGVRSL
jgi:formylglycine-generating enzyme required for sulfatase activity